MSRITEGQIARLISFVYARISDADSSREMESRRMVAALRLVADRQIAAVRYYRSSPARVAALTELHATASWNLLVSVAEIWRDHSDFPTDAAVETFEFDEDSPLMRQPE